MTLPATHKDYIVIGQIGASYGIKGWFHVHSNIELGIHLLSFSTWYLQDDEQQWQPVQIEGCRTHGKGLVAKVATVFTPEAVRTTLTHRNIALKRKDLSVDEEDYFWSDLEGLTVINQRGEHLGIITQMMATGANDVLIVKGEKEHAIPYLRHSVILSIDLNKREIHVNWEIL